MFLHKGKKNMQITQKNDCVLFIIKYVGVYSYRIISTLVDIVKFSSIVEVYSYLIISTLVDGEVTEDDDLCLFLPYNFYSCRLAKETA